ncbi:MAG: hypothetical protein K0R65_1154 [Crocinitomicaceae bacterium]|jgi:hypothetical protein|nr:hypothetical protein [Crocinitomicaceae bacterium]
MKHKLLFFIALIIAPVLWSQTKKPEPSLENFKRKYRYVKEKGYKGPANTYHSPASMQEQGEEMKQSDPATSSNGGTIQYSPEEIDRIRERRAQQQQQQQEYQDNEGNGGGPGNGQGNGRGEGGNKPRNPEMGKPQPIEFDPPDIDTPDMDLDIDPPSFSASIGKIVLIVLAALALLLILYLIIKNYRPRNKRVKSQLSQEEWNPETISKTELELRLEQAMLENDYRECVRIYFTFILKEMIRLRLIRWKKELTNFDYLLQAQATPNYREFEESVRIYDLVWYGDYNISKQDYQALERHLDRHYKLLNTQNA